MKNEPFKGRVKIGEHSSLRKLKRAMRRDRVPPERMAIIDAAMDSAAKRADVYLHSMARGMARLRRLIAARG